MRGGRLFLLIVLSLIPGASPLGADPQSLPRFASLRSKMVNAHVGPGSQYPHEYCYVRQGLPVEIVAEFDVWRQIRDPAGALSWVHKSLLSGKRHVMVLQKNRKLFAKPDTNSTVLAIVAPNVIGRLLECRQDWCRLHIDGYKGWLKRRFLWGTYPHE